jgi:hypothetical protein
MIPGRKAFKVVVVGTTGDHEGISEASSHPWIEPTYSHELKNASME